MWIFFLSSLVNIAENSDECRALLKEAYILIAEREAQAKLERRPQWASEKAGVDPVDVYFDSLPSLSVLSASEELTLFRAFEAASIRGFRGANKIAEHIARSNLRLVASVAKRIATRSSESDWFPELIDVGNLSLVEKIIPGFDPNSGYRFSTYAFRILRADMRDEMQRAAFPFHLNLKALYKLRRYSLWVDSFWQAHQRMPLPHEIASAREIPIEAAERLSRLLSNRVFRGNDEGESILNDIGIDHRRSPDRTDGKALVRASLPAVFEPYIARIPNEKARQILLLSIESGNRITDAEIAKTMSISREGARLLKRWGFELMRIFVLIDNESPAFKKEDYPVLIEIFSTLKPKRTPAFYKKIADFFNLSPEKVKALEAHAYLQLQDVIDLGRPRRAGSSKGDEE